MAFPHQLSKLSLIFSMLCQTFQNFLEFVLIIGPAIWPCDSSYAPAKLCLCPAWTLTKYAEPDAHRFPSFVPGPSAQQGSSSQQFQHCFLSSSASCCSFIYVTEGL